jgi:excisionase family DNA binding protein
MREYDFTLYEACEYLNRSKKTISRLIRKGKLHPKRVKSQQGTLEYRFNKADLNKFKAILGAEPTDETRQDRQAPKTPATALKRRDRADETGQDKQQDKSFTGMFHSIVETLKDQLKAKDKQIDTLNGQIDQLIERDRETNILLKGLQDRLMLAEKNPIEQAGQSKKGDKRKLIIIISLLAVVIIIIAGLFLLGILRF